MSGSPSVVILAGPNGAGKSTAAATLLQGALGVAEFVNADVIARGLSAFDPESAAIAAGRVMLARLKELAEQRIDFAFETTLSSRSFAPWLQKLRESGYRVYLVFLWLPSADVAIERVAQRARTHGQHVPPDIVRRRYQRGMYNFVTLYHRVVTTWYLYDSRGRIPKLVAESLETGAIEIYDRKVWEQVERHGATDET